MADVEADEAGLGEDILVQHGDVVVTQVKVGKEGGLQAWQHL